MESPDAVEAALVSCDMAKLLVRSQDYKNNGASAKEEVEILHENIKLAIKSLRDSPPSSVKYLRLLMCDAYLQYRHSRNYQKALDTLKNLHLFLKCDPRSSYKEQNSSTLKENPYYYLLVLSIYTLNAKCLFRLNRHAEALFNLSQGKILSKSILFQHGAIKQQGSLSTREYTFPQWHNIYSKTAGMVRSQGIGPLEGLEIVMQFYSAHEKIVERCYGLE